MHFCQNYTSFLTMVLLYFCYFMSLWAVIFMELWKRYSAKITHHWDATYFDTLEEHPRPEYLAKLSTVKKNKVNFITGLTTRDS
ncbi:anoctamin-7-like [Tachypleus tridentatus]|uniref:anoctamin-7-like n=1 Tax=Tachypleus tridentatus TaxID=6853 RepID=UPI003FD5C33B